MPQSSDRSWFADGLVSVTLNGDLVGLLTMDNLGEYMRIQAALKS